MGQPSPAPQTLLRKVNKFSICSWCFKLQFQPPQISSSPNVDIIKIEQLIHWDLNLDLSIYIFLDSSAAINLWICEHQFHGTQFTAPVVNLKERLWIHLKTVVRINWKRDISGPRLFFRSRRIWRVTFSVEWRHRWEISKHNLSISWHIFTRAWRNLFWTSNLNLKLMRVYKWMNDEFVNNSCLLVNKLKKTKLVSKQELHWRTQTYG